MTEITFGIEGMSCNGCVKTVTQALQSIAGVESAQVSLADARATVRFDDTRTQPDALHQAVQDAGFDVRAE
ncbi:MAG: heavy-metal-associated domain-containing protein [Rhodocyclaceae bacterium]|nr:heavy-metal-associated domain-containing protein [Rhodocyclaceae bacterium]